MVVFDPAFGYEVFVVVSADHAITKIIPDLVGEDEGISAEIRYSLEVLLEFAADDFGLVGR